MERHLILREPRELRRVPKGDRIVARVGPAFARASDVALFFYGIISYIMILFIIIGDI